MVIRTLLENTMFIRRTRLVLRDAGVFASLVCHRIGFHVHTRRGTFTRTVLEKLLRAYLPACPKR
jgi:hypothetical protein